ncbi:unnamed protein product [Rhizophagus irregularis]|nr:unnamed protein product [Rhizophagus irregularis]
MIYIKISKYNKNTALNLYSQPVRLPEFGQPVRNSNQDLSGQLVKELLWYNNKIGPIDWWNGFQQEVPVLSKFAVKLMSIPASNAASERNWSNFGFIQNIKRNRLTNERTFKLVSIYSNLRLANGQKLNNDNINKEELENLDEIIVIEESEKSNIEH